MKKTSSFLFLAFILLSSAGAEIVCNDAWYHAVEKKISSADGQGHGPDVGSDEWKGVVEFKLGLSGKADLPPRNSAAWCQTIDRALNKTALPKASTASAQSGKNQAPSFSCHKVEPGSIAAMVCADAELSALDRQLAEVYAAASKKARNEHPPTLKAEQRGWIKGRDDCWKSSDKRACVQAVYALRIAELQAFYRLVPSQATVRYVCDGNPAKEVTATYFRTDPPTLIAEHGDSVSLMYLQPSASGAKYQGRNELLWEHQGEALIQWGYQAPEMRCEKR